MKILTRVWHRKRDVVLSSVVFSFILALIFSVNPSIVQAAANTTLFFNPASPTAVTDQQLDLAARVNPGTNQVSGVTMNITYDQTKFRLDSITPSSTFSLVLAAAVINNTNGTASISLGVPLGNPSVTTTTTVATFSFHTLATVSNSSIAFASSSLVSADDMVGQNALSVRTPATVTVTGSGDVTAPTIADIDSPHANGSFKLGEVIPIEVTFSENVSSTGNVTVTLETGTTDRTCTFTITNALMGTCNYTVQAGDTSADLNVNTVAGTINDQSSNPMVVFTSTVSLATNKAIVIDTTAPTNQDTVFTPSVLKMGGASTTIVSAAETGGAVWFAPSGTATFVAGATMTTASGTATSILSPATTGAYKLFVIDAAGNVSAPSTATLTVDAAPPTAAITYSDADGIVKVGDSLIITATFSEPLADSPVVKMALSGSTTLVATNMTKSDTTHYTYTHSVGASNGVTTVALSIGTDVVGNVVTSAPTSGATFIIDNTAPTVSIYDPLDGTNVAGSTVSVSADGYDAVGIVGVQFKLDGVNLGSEVMSDPYSVVWDATGSALGSHVLTAVARDAVGHSTTSSSVTVNNVLDNTSPTVALTSPVDGSTVYGTTTTVSADAADNIAVAGVQFKLDGVNLGPEDMVAPYSVVWDTTQIANGTHTLTAVARDTSDITTTSIPRTVTVSNAAVVPPSSNKNTDSGSSKKDTDTRQKIAYHIKHKAGERTSPFVTIKAPVIGSRVTNNGKSIYILAHARDASGVQAMVLSSDEKYIKQRVKGATLKYTYTRNNNGFGRYPKAFYVIAYDNLGNKKTVGITIENLKVTAIRVVASS